MNTVPEKKWLEHEACYWRHVPGAHWQKGNVVQVMNDKLLSIKVHCHKGGYAYVPNDTRHIKERKR